MLPSDWRVCIYSFLTFFIQTQAETDEQEVVERPQEDPVIARRVESVHRREAQKEGDGRMEEKGKVKLLEVVLKCTQDFGFMPIWRGQ